MSATHLFLAPPAAAFGEVVTGLRIARAVAAEGDRVVFLAGADVAVLFEGSGIVHRPIDDHVFSLKRHVTRLVAAERCTSLTLVDVTSVFLTLDPIGVELDFLERLSIPVVALDFWNLRRAGPAWDFGREATPIPPAALAFERRLLPAPIAPPDAGPGVFAALPEPDATRPRDEVRAELGLGAPDRLLIWPTSRWQQPELQNWKHHARLARLAPVWLAAVLEGLGDRAHVLHVGPQASEAWAAWGSRYRFAGQVPPSRLADLMGAADLLLTLNATATTNFTAIALGLPTVAVFNSRSGPADEVTTEVSSDRLRAWLADAAPLHRFRLWPLGLFEFLAPVWAANPYADAMLGVELLDEAALLESCRALLFDDEAAARLREAQARYRERVRALPGPAPAFRAVLG